MATYKKIVVYYNKLSSDDTAYLVSATLKLIAPLKFTAEQDPRIFKGLRDLDTAVQAYDNLKQAKPVVTVTNLKELDKARDRDYRDLRDYIDIQSRSRQVAKQEAAKKLQTLFEPYKQLHRQTNSEQSSQLNRLIKLCDDREVRSLLNQIGASELVSNLKESQAQFEQAHLKKMEGKSQKTTNPKKEKLDNLLRLYKTIYRYLISLEEFGIDSYHRPILAAFNDVRQTFVDKQKRQTKKKETRTSEPLALLDQPKD